VQNAGKYPKHLDLPAVWNLFRVNKETATISAWASTMMLTRAPAARTIAWMAIPRKMFKLPIIKRCFAILGELRRFALGEGRYI